MNELLGSVIKKKLSLNKNISNNGENTMNLEKHTEENLVIIKSIQKNLDELRELRIERQKYQEKIYLEKRKNLELFTKFEKIYEENKKLKDEISRLCKENTTKENLLKENSLQELISNKRKHIESVLIK